MAPSSHCVAEREVPDGPQHLGVIMHLTSKQHVPFQVAWITLLSQSVCRVFIFSPYSRCFLQHAPEILLLMSLEGTVPQGAGSFLQLVRTGSSWSTVLPQLALHPSCDKCLNEPLGRDAASTKASALASTSRACQLPNNLVNNDIAFGKIRNCVTEITQLQEVALLLP